MTTAAKGLFLFLSFAILQIPADPAPAFFSAALAFTGIGCFLQPRGGHLSFFCCALLSVGFGLRMGWEPRPVGYPRVLRAVTAEDRFRAVRLQGEVGREAASGWFLAKVDRALIDSRERITRGRRHVRSFWGPWTELERIESLPRFVLFTHFGDIQVRPGCRYDLRFYGRSLPREAVDSSFDTFVKSKGAAASVRVRSWNIVALDCPPPSWRENIVRRVEQSLTDHAKLTGRTLQAAMALLLGQAGMLDKEFKSMGRELGILHIFAASGFHLAVFYACFHLPLRRFFGRMHPASLLLPLPLCFFYLVLLDFPVSLSRAFVFVSFAALKSVIHRRTTHADTLLNTAMVLLFWMPNEVFSLSSVLSFGAAAGILYFYKPVLDSLPPVRNRFCRFVSAEFALGASAGIVAVPILLAAFRAHSFSSPVVNLVLGPLTAFALPVLSLFAALSFLPMDRIYLEFLGAPVRWVMTAFVASTESASRMSLYVKYPFALSWLVLPAVVLPALLILEARKRQEGGGSAGRFRGGIRVCLALVGPVGAFFSLAAGSLLEFVGVTATGCFGNAADLRFDFRSILPVISWVTSLFTVLLP